MDRNEAMQVLAITDADDLEDRYDKFELAVFQIKDYVLRNAPVASLYHTRIRKLERLQMAAGILELDQDQSAPVQLPVLQFETGDLLVFMRQYESQLTGLRLRASNTSTVNGLIAIMQQLLKLQEAYLIRLESYQPTAKAVENKAESRKIGEQLDSGVLIRLLEKEKVQDLTDEELGLILSEKERAKRQYEMQAKANLLSY